MSRIAFLMTAALAAMLLLLAGGPALGAGGDEKASRKARITFTSEVRAGDLLLLPGDYTVQCREEGSGRVMHFKRDGRAKTSKSGAVAEGVVPCRVEALPGKASRTALRLQTDGEVPRVTRIEVAGEDVAHLL